MARKLDQILVVDVESTCWDGACERIGMKMEGTHHRGDDDAWNIAAILCTLLAGARNACK